MKRPLLIAYQMLTGLSDSLTGLFLMLAPAFTLHLMKLDVAAQALPFLSYIGAFVLSVGIACLYGAALAVKSTNSDKLEVVWLLTAVTRSLVAAFVAIKIALGVLEAAWATVAITDGAFALLQFTGLAKGWLRHVRD